MKFQKLSVLFAVIVLFVSVLACGSTAPVGVSNIYMASDEDGNNKTTTFAPTDTIYVFFDVNGIETGAQLQARWYALNVEGQDPNSPFSTSDYTYDGEDTIYANIESTDSDGFPAAQYKVEIYLNGAKVGEQQFSIQ